MEKFGSGIRDKHPGSVKLPISHSNPKSLFLSARRYFFISLTTDVMYGATSNPVASFVLYPSSHWSALMPIYPISCRQHLAPSNPRSRLTRSSCRSSVKHWRRSSKARSQSHQRPSAAAAAALQRRDNSQRRQLG
jgi:hypothetical protein